jgi:hypothetical protein
LVPEFNVGAARFRWRLSSTAHGQEQHGDRQQYGDRGESFENCWHRVIFLTAVLRIRAVSVAVVAAFNFDRRPPERFSPPLDSNDSSCSALPLWRAGNTRPQKKKFHRVYPIYYFENLCAVCDVLLQNDSFAPKADINSVRVCGCNYRTPYVTSPEFPLGE